jgi:Mg/Co/Ni transporter MgtE
MVKYSPLTLAFLEQKPVSASRELASLKAEEAALFLDEIPARFAAPVLAAMAPWSGASILNKMNAVSAAAALKEIEYRDASAILRCISGKDRVRILDELPKKLHRDFDTSLKYPGDTVGAHMTTSILTMTGEHDVADAIEILRRAEKSRLDVIYVVGSDYKLAGIIAASELLRHPRDTLLSKILDDSVARVSARATLASLNDLSAWDDFGELPVISRKNQVIGALQRRVVAEVVRNRPVEVTNINEPIIVSMLDAFLTSVQGLALLLAGVEKSSSSKVERHS